MAERKQTTAEERAEWKRDCEEQEVVEFSRGIVVRLLADVERLDALCAQLVGEEMLHQDGGYETAMERLTQQVEAGRDTANALESMRIAFKPINDMMYEAGLYHSIQNRATTAIACAREAGLLEGGG